MYWLKLCSNSNRNNSQTGNFKIRKIEVANGISHINGCIETNMQILAFVSTFERLFYLSAALLHESVSLIVFL